MATTTFSGPVKAGTIQNTTGTTYGDAGDVANTGWVVMYKRQHLLIMQVLVIF